MIQHTVCFALVHTADSEAERDFLSAAAEVLPSVPGVSAFRIARQIGTQSEYRWQFSMDFSDEAAYAAYDAHPDHRAFVGTRWIPEVAAFQEFDFVPFGGER
ncbi:Dabb family protein [Leifsonia poae]|uniref:Dabb family protein n=1 Tax=Leifsonia poae TaxID=110933 RepID=UPI001CBDBEB3|nr:Dabb family protein [Leifsonia poae]